MGLRRIPADRRIIAGSGIDGDDGLGKALCTEPIGKKHIFGQKYANLRINF